MNTLKFAVIHSLDKELGNVIASIRLGAAVLDVDSANVIKLAERLTRLIVDGSGTLLWGQFGDNNREGKFPAAVRKIQSKMTKDGFYAMSKTTMDELKHTINGVNFATGGYVCFLVYELNGNTFLLIVMIKERDALTLNDKFEPKEINEIDLTKLHQAARINLSRFGEVLAQKNSASADDDDSTEQTYLCFAKAKGDREISDYFIKAMGCEEGVSSSRATKGVIKGIAKYIQSKPEIKAYADRARELTLEYLLGQKDGQTINIEHVIAAARRSVEPSLEGYFDGLKAFLSDEQNKVPHEFPVNHKALNQWVSIKGSGNGWKISFENRLLGYEGAQIVYNREAQSLTFTQLPASTIEDIETTLDGRQMAPTSNKK